MDDELMGDDPIPGEPNEPVDGWPDFTDYIMEPGGDDFFSDIPDAPKESDGLPDLSDLAVTSPTDPLNLYSSDSGRCDTELEKPLNLSGIVEPPKDEYDCLLDEIGDEAERRRTLPDVSDLFDPPAPDGGDMSDPVKAKTLELAREVSASFNGAPSDIRELLDFLTLSDGDTIAKLVNADGSNIGTLNIKVDDFAHLIIRVLIAQRVLPRLNLPDVKAFIDFAEACEADPSSVSEETAIVFKEFNEDSEFVLLFLHRFMRDKAVEAIGELYNEACHNLDRLRGKPSCLRAPAHLAEKVQGLSKQFIRRRITGVVDSIPGGDEETLPGKVEHAQMYVSSAMSRFRQAEQEQFEREKAVMGEEAAKVARRKRCTSKRLAPLVGKSPQRIRSMVKTIYKDSPKPMEALKNDFLGD